MALIDRIPADGSDYWVVQWRSLEMRASAFWTYDNREEAYAAYATLQGQPGYTVSIRYEPGKGPVSWKPQGPKA